MEWLNSLFPDLSLPINASDEELRAFFIDGTVLCQLLNKLKPGSVTEVVLCHFFICKIAISVYGLIMILNVCYVMVLPFSRQNHGQKM